MCDKQTTRNGERILKHLPSYHAMRTKRAMTMTINASIVKQRKVYKQLLP